MREIVDRLFVDCDEVVALTGGPEAGVAWRRPAAEGLGVVADGAIAVRDGRVVAVAPSADLRERFEASRELSLRGLAVVPGLIDATLGWRDEPPAEVLALGTTTVGVRGAASDLEGEPRRVGQGDGDGDDGIVVANEPDEIDRALDRGARAIVGARGVSVANAERLAEASCVVVIGVDDVLDPGVEAAPARELIDAGCAVALAPGMTASAPRSLRAVVGIARVGLSLTLAEALVGVTRNAALALGVPDLGSLRPGARADFVALDTVGHRAQSEWRDGGPVPFVVMGGRPAVAHVRRSQLENPW